MHRLFALGAPEFELTREQWVPRPMEEVFPFFEDPRNLPRITPPWLGFQITDMQPEVIQQGTLITYRLRWFGIPYRWQTLIAEWVPAERFIDTQIHGPYILWHHTHAFQACQDGVLLQDRVRYRLPFGLLGVLMKHLVVRGQLDTIFDFRLHKIAELLADGKVYRHPPHRSGQPV